MSSGLARGQNLSSFSIPNPTMTEKEKMEYWGHWGSMLKPRPRVQYLQSITGTDTTTTPNYFFALKIYNDHLNDLSDSTALFDGDYAIGSCVSSLGDTVLVCINKDLSVRFTFPPNTNNASPFENGLSLISYKPWWGFHFADALYGSVARDGSVLFEPEHKVVNIVRNKAIAVDALKYNDVLMSLYHITIKNEHNEIEASFIYYVPKDYGCFDSGNSFWQDLDNNETDLFQYVDDIYYNCLYSALINIIRTDFLTAYRQLQIAKNSQVPLIRKCAKKNLKTIKCLFN